MTKNITYFKVATVEDSFVVAKRLHNLFSEVDELEYTGNARNITDALHLVSLQKPNALILDINLSEDESGKNGIDLLKLLRDKYPDMYVIMMTNLSDKIYKTLCLELGANYFLDKTQEFTKLPEILKEIYLQDHKECA